MLAAGKPCFAHIDGLADQRTRKARAIWRARKKVTLVAQMLTRMGQLVSISVIGLAAVGCAALDQTESGDGNLFERLSVGQSAADVPDETESPEIDATEPQADLFVMGRNFWGRLTQPQETETGTESSGFSLGGLGNLFGQSNDAGSENDANESETGNRYQVAEDPYTVAAVQSGLRGSESETSVDTAVLPPYEPMMRSFAYQKFDGTSAQAMMLINQMGAASTYAASGRQIVPLAFDALPDDMGNGDASNKELFISIMIPLAVMVNEQTAAERQAILQSGYRGPIVSAPLLVRQIADRYDVTTDVDTLLRHVDTLPVSLMIAQAIEESGWGTSRFAQEGNALFGQYTWEDDDRGMVPTGRPAGQTFRVRAFATLFDSVQSYALNLNRNQAYADLRALRQSLRAQGQVLSGSDLVQGLSAYSGDPAYYIPAISRHLEDNSLALYDRVQLMPGQAVRVHGASAPAGN